MHALAMIILIMFNVATFAAYGWVVFAVMITVEFVAAIGVVYHD